MEVFGDEESCRPSIEDHKCCICKESEEKLVQVSLKGISTLRKFSEERKDPNLTNFLSSASVVYVHEECRKRYNNKRRIQQERNSTEDIKRAKDSGRRSSATEFNFKVQCLFCCNETKNDKKEWHKAETLQIRETLMKYCLERLEKDNNDEWATSVFRRITSCIDFVAAEARYHQNCRIKFSMGRNIGENNQKKRGRVTNKTQREIFLMTCEWLESEIELYTVSQFKQKMEEFCVDEDAYTKKHIKNLLQEHYGENIMICSHGHGSEDVISFKNMASYLINKKYKEKKQTLQEECKRIILAAANLIKDEIRNIKSNKEYYPQASSINLKDCKSWLPEGLKTFLNVLIPNSEPKLVSIGQSIVQACRSKSILSPIMFGLGITLDHTYGSKWLTDELSRVGFSISSDEVKRFKQSVLVAKEDQNSYPPVKFVQWSADNVDHNLATLTGKGTFHGMGIIASFIPETTIRPKVIKRLKDRLLINEVTKENTIPIIEYVQGHERRDNQFTAYTDLASKFDDELFHSNENINLVWYASSLRSPDIQRPNWSGFMQHIYGNSEQDYSKSTVSMLPMIDMSPSNETCIYSTLLYVIEESKKYNIKSTPVITFDQPLWLKAFNIINDKNLNIICRLGGFHILMSFLGSIGKFMSFSGIEEILSLVYAKNVVPHILSGKAYARAIRAHILLDAALHKLMLNEIDIPESVKNYIDELISNQNTSTNAIEDDLEIIQKHLKIMMKKLTESRTGRYWMQYQSYIKIVKTYIFAERTGNWELHLFCISKMLNLFAATGHIHYAKSARMYLQQMIQLKNTHPDLHKQFSENGLFTIRRSDRFWAGLWSDLVIEQVMMRSIKSRGGLTRGRGFTESVREQWVHTAHDCAMIHDAITELTSLHLISSEQHVEMGKSRMKIDNEDLCKMYTWLEQHSPFQIDTSLDNALISLSNGMIADENCKVNCDYAEKIGESIQTNLDGKDLNGAKIKRKETIVTMESIVNSVKIKDKEIVLKPTLLFTRLIAIAQREENLEHYFDYELTSYPMSLFKHKFMRKPDKASLRNHLLTFEAERPVLCKRVVDGGMLLHKTRWPKNITYAALVGHYVKSAKRDYGECFIVFDGYNSKSTKDHEHLRRAFQKRSVEIAIDENLPIQCSQEDFLSSNANKNQLVELLAKHLLQDGQNVIVSINDADKDIVKCAIELANTNNVEVVADDTDVAMLLIHHYTKNLKQITFTSEKSKKSWNINQCADELGENAKYVMPIHAWTGCDTVSAIFGKGKVSAYKKIIASNYAKSLIQDIVNTKSNQDTIATAGIKLFVYLYNGSELDTLRELRYSKFHEMALKGEIAPEKMPPTDNSAQYHSLRAHLQIDEWENLENTLNPLEWGWQLGISTYDPVFSDKELAPENLLNFIRCKCKTNCESGRCSCRKYSITCVPACGYCKGDCANSEIFVEADETDNYGNLFENLFGI